MNIKDVADLVIPNISPDETDTAETLQEKIRGLSVELTKFETLAGLNDQTENIETLHNIVELISEFPVEQLQTIANKAKRKDKKTLEQLGHLFELSLQRLRKEIKNKITQQRLDSDLIEAQTFFQLKAKLLLLLGKQKSRKFPSRLLLFTISLIPAIFTYFLGVYIKLDRSTTLLQSQTLSPHSAYLVSTDQEGHYDFSQTYTSQFWREFSRYYFKKPNGFSNLFFNDEDDRKHIVKLKLVLENSSRSNPLMVSTLDAVVRYEEEHEFPWQNLDVKPSIKGELSEGQIKFINRGVGPALDFTYEGKTRSGIVHYHHKKEILEFETSNTFERGASNISLDDCGHYDSEVGIQKLNNDQLEKPLFYSQNDTVEVINTLSRLQEITEVSYNEPISFNYTYNSLRGETYQGVFRTNLPKNLAYYRTENLSEYDPTTGKTCPAPVEPSQSVTSSLSLPSIQAPFSQITPSALAAALQPSNNEGVSSQETPKGVDLITKNISFKLDKLVAGQSHAVSINPDQFLNPEGLLFIYLELPQPKNGAYSVSVSLNGEELKTISFKTLVPESYEFNYPDSLKHFSETTE